MVVIISVLGLGTYLLFQKPTTQSGSMMKKDSAPTVAQKMMEKE